MRNFTLHTALAALVLASCGSESDVDLFEGDGADDAFMDALTMSASEAYTLLGLLNSPSTDLAFLDNEVKLNALAAQHIIEHRNGADDRYPSSDDRPFSSLEQLDRVKYVGPLALQTLRAFAAQHPVLAVELVEGVEFSGEQAAAVIWGVNAASETELVGEVGLDSVAARNLASHKPYASVAAMGLVYWVGPANLTRLRAFAPTWAERKAAAEAQSLAGTFDGVTFDESIAQAALQIANEATLAELLDGGVWSTGAERIVNARPFATLLAVAQTYGIGTATMGGLYHFAVSGRWLACNATPAPRNEPAVSAYHAATWAYDTGEDRNKTRFAAYSVATCIDPVAQTQMLSNLLIEHAGWEWVVRDFPQVLEYGSVTPGNASLMAILDHSMQWMRDRYDEHMAAGDPNAQADYDEIVSLYSQVIALAGAHPAQTYSLKIHIEASECSETAALIVDLATGLIIAAHQGPGC